MNPIYLILGILAFAVAAYFALEFVGGKFTVIDDWKKAWKFYSVWAFAIVAAIPDAYNAVIASGLLDGSGASETLTWSIRAAAIGGLLLRFVKQAQPKLPDDTDQAGA